MFLIRKNRCLNKKADTSTGVIVAVIISVIAFVILILLIRNNPNTKEAQENTIYQDSVLMAHMAQLTGQSFTNQIKCPYRSIVIKDKNEDKIKEIFAESMVTCWKNFHQGKYKFSSDTTDRYCFPCYHISFDEKIAKENLEITNFINYLSENNPKGESVSYLSFLNIEDADLKKNEIDKEAQAIEGSVQDTTDWSTLNSNNDYLILFTENKMLDLDVFMEQMGIGAGAGGIVGRVIVVTFLGSSPAGWVVATGSIILGASVGPKVINSITSNIPFLNWDNTQRFPGIIIIGYDKENQKEIIGKLSELGCNIEGKFSDMR